MHSVAVGYCRTGFDSDSLTAAKIATENDRYRWNSLKKIMPIIHYIEVVFPFMGSLSFLFDFEGNANISVAIKSGSTVPKTSSSVLFIR